MPSPPLITNPSPSTGAGAGTGSGAGAGTGSAPIAVSQDEHKLPSLGPPLPGRYGVILKGGMSTVVVDLVQSPLAYEEFGKEQERQQQLGVPSRNEPAAPRRSYLAAVQASNQPFAHRKTLFPADADFVPPASPPLPLSQTDLGCYPPKGPDDEIWFLEPGELRKRILGKLHATPGLYKPNLEGHIPRDWEMEAAVIQEFIAHKEAQRARLRDGFFGDPRWLALLGELHALERKWQQGSFEERKEAISPTGLPEVRLRIRAVLQSYGEAYRAISAELAGIQFHVMAVLPAKPLAPAPHENKKSCKWLLTTTGPPHSLSGRVLTPVERPLGTVGPEVLPPDPVVDFPSALLARRRDRSSAASLPKMFELTLDNKEVVTPDGRYEFYKTHGFHAARHYLDHIKSKSDQPRNEVDVPKWFYIFESENNVSYSNSETAQGRYMDLNFHLGSLAVKVRDDKAAEHIVGSHDSGQSSGLPKMWHEPHPQWTTDVRRRMGGWWRCRSGNANAAPLAERRCRLCHGEQPIDTSSAVDDKDTTQAKFVILMDRILAAQHVIAENDKHVVESRMRAADAEAARQHAAAARQASSSSLLFTASSSSPAPGDVVKRVAAELSAENAAHDRVTGRPLGSTADRERSDVANRHDSLKNRLSAPF